MTDSPVAERATKLIASILADLHLDTWDCEFAGGVLRFTFDKPVGEGNVNLDELSLATRLINRELEHAEPEFPNVAIEVTSPGLERTLRTPEHYQRSIGKDVAIRLFAGAEGDRRLHGTLSAADGDTITVDSDGASRTVRYGLIERAKTVFVWGPTPKPGRPTSAKTSKKKSATADQTPAGRAASRPISKSSDEIDPEPVPKQSCVNGDSEMNYEKELAS